MKSIYDIVAVKRQDDSLLITPRVDFRDLDPSTLEQASSRLRKRYLGDQSFLHVIVDLQYSDSLGSSGLGIIVGLWKCVASRNGRLAFCRVRRHTKEMLKCTNLNRLWDVYATPEKALEAFKESQCETG